MMECEKVIVDNLVKEGTIKFYGHYVDDTLLLVKGQDLDKLLKEFNGFLKYLKVTVDKFKNETSHFLDLEIYPYSLTIFKENTHTRLFTLWTWQAACIRPLVDWAKKIYSKENLPKKLPSIKKLTSWNGYPKNIVNTIIKHDLSKETLANDVISNEKNIKRQGSLLI